MSTNPRPIALPSNGIDPNHNRAVALPGRGTQLNHNRAAAVRS
jgi:hypothetical protein